jgi:hypothetical protein
VPKTVTAEPEVVETSAADQPPKQTRTLRLSLKPKAPVVEPEPEPAVELPPVAVVADDAAVAETAAQAVTPAQDDGPVLSPAERREAILRRLREEGDTTLPPRRDAGDKNALPAFRYPVNRFAR